MKIADYHRKRRALAFAGVASNQPKEETHADQDHEEQPQDRQGPREARTEGQGEGRRAGEEARKGQMNFGAALEEATENGRRITREGWNGKGQWVCFMPPVVIPHDMVNERTRKYVPSGHLNVGGYFVMWTAARVWQPGWLASQADMLADDWVCLKDDAQ